MVSPRRISQRAPRSCKQCAKRKLRCSKDIPCTNCVARGWESECDREEVLLSKNLLPPSSTTGERRSSRLGQTTDGHPADNSRVTASFNSIATNPAEANEDFPSTLGLSPFLEAFNTPEARCLPVDDDDSDSNSTTATTLGVQRTLAPEAISSLESIAWSSHNDATQPQALTGPLSQRLLQNVQQSSIPFAFEQVIFDFHQNSLAWMHNIVHIPSFKSQCERLRRDGNMTGTAEETLYFALLAVRMWNALSACTSLRHRPDHRPASTT